MEDLEEIIKKLKKENESLKQENAFLKKLYSGTSEFKSIEQLASKDLWEDK